MRTEARRDAYPEFYAYADQGCDVSPSCLNCPLAVCKYDLPGASAFFTQRRKEMLNLWRKGEPADAIAIRYGVSKRTVNRAIEGKRDSCGSLRPRRPSTFRTFPDDLPLPFQPGLWADFDRSQVRRGGKGTLGDELGQIIGELKLGRVDHCILRLGDLRDLMKGRR